MTMKKRPSTRQSTSTPPERTGVPDDYYRMLFEYAPISLWEEDYSQVKAYLNKLRAKGVEDLDAYLDENPQAVTECMERIKVLNVNRKTLELFAAKNQAELVAHLDVIFRDEMRLHFKNELVDMWQGRLAYEREGINYALNGRTIDINLHWTVLPGYENTLGRVLVSISDITARKKAERYLTYLGTHDVLTGLYNRAYFEEERERLYHGRRFPVSVLIGDLDGLKETNDSFGHVAGDELLRRAAEVLRASFRAEDVVARLGGDEFGVILAETDELAAAASIERIQHLVDINNTYYQGPRLSLSMGAAAAQRGMNLEEAQRLADDRMYQIKRQRKSSGDRKQNGLFA